MSQGHSGCSSVRLEYSSGGRVVAGSNPVIPTESEERRSKSASPLFAFILSVYFSLSVLAYDE